MKMTKWMFLVVFIFSITLTDINAQKPTSRTPDERGALTLERYKKDISLTSEQQTKILSLAINAIQKCDSINLLDSLTIKDRILKKGEAYSELNNQILKNLSASQKEQLRIKQAARDNAREGKN